MGIAAGLIDDHHACRRAGIDVDGIEARAVRGHDQKIRRPLQQILGRLGGGVRDGSARSRARNAPPSISPPNATSPRAKSVCTLLDVNQLRNSFAASGFYPFKSSSSSFTVSGPSAAFAW